MKDKQEKVWVVTGSSGGLGLSMVKALLKHDIRVAAFSRNAEAVEKAVGSGETDRFIALSVKLHVEDEVIAAGQKVLEKFGAADVVVNNAGHSQRGAIEEATDKEARSAFNDNFFSELNMMRFFVPVMRRNGWGYFINLASSASLKAKDGSGIYCATKHAVAGLTESAAEELEPFGISLTCVKPCDMRTNYLVPGHLMQTENKMACYEQIRVLKAIDDEETHRAQPGDPDKVAELFIELAERDRKPRSLFLDYPAEDIVPAQLKERRDELDRWEYLAGTVETESK